MIEGVWKAKKHCYLPVLTEKNALFFVRYQYGDALHLNRYSIFEPIDHTHILAAENLDSVLMPLVAFDKQGHRLGAGGGYYDRTFGFLAPSSSKKPHMIGLAYAVQEAEFIPSDPWDIALNGVVTEKEFLIFP